MKDAKGAKSEKEKDFLFGCVLGRFGAISGGFSPKIADFDNFEGHFASCGN